MCEGHVADELGNLFLLVQKNTTRHTRTYLIGRVLPALKAHIVNMFEPTYGRAYPVAQHVLLLRRSLYHCLRLC